ncbi:unnamed protein product, partial [marine sediment metagenome]
SSFRERNRIGEIRSTRKIEGLVHCPRCGTLAGFKFEAPKVEKIRFKLGGKELPTIDMKNLGDFDPTILCPNEDCRYTFKLSEAVIKPPEKEEDYR